VHALETYFQSLHTIRSTGAATPETSYYGALETLFNEIGKSLKPKVRCVMNLKNRGAGLPDGGFFTPDQFQKVVDDELLSGQTPARGVIEVKSTGQDAWLTADGEQVSRYWGEYGQALVTNLRDFLLVGRDAEGKPAKMESYRFAPNEALFWKEAAHPRRFALAHGERFAEFVKRVMLHSAALATPKDVAWFLASYARDAKARIEGKELPALETLRAALEQALGINFKDRKDKKQQIKGERFFRSTLIQTVFYGIFSAWVLWAKRHPPTDTKARFSWKETIWYLHVPMIRALFEQIATPAKLGPLGLVEVLDWTESALNRVDRAAFFSRFETDQAVQYFYEPFLHAFDPELRKELGVWFTPPEIVRYMVARVDTVLQTELDIPDGLADPRVYVLDPCCGTGAYLVEVLRRIEATYRESYADAGVGHDVKKAALTRIFGFEILPSPFVVAHLQVGLYLQSLGAPLVEDTEERAGVYLTNALTGWEPPQGPKQHLIFPEMEEERDAAEEVKREKPILVILGNPPYNAFAGVSPEEERGLVEPYKEGLITKWRIKKFNLDDLYVRFFRLAERRIAEMTGKGVVSFISNHSWVSDPSFVVLRERLLGAFDQFWIENMHGNRKISEYGPDGRTSETVFAIRGFSPGITQGVAVSLWIKSGKGHHAKVFFRDDLNASKAVERRGQLLESLSDPQFDARYIPAEPKESNWLSFKPVDIDSHYLDWPVLVDLCAVAPSNGLMEKRQGALMSVNRRDLEDRMRAYYDPDVAWDALKAMGTGLTKDAARFQGGKTRDRVLSAERYNPDQLRRYSLRPFDNVWCYYSAIRPLWNEPRPALWAQCWEGNSFLVSRFRAAKVPEGPPFYYVTGLSDDHLLSPDASCFPLFLKTRANEKGLNQDGLFDATNCRELVPRANLSIAAKSYLATLCSANPDDDTEAASSIWMHALAIGYSPDYLTENADGIRQNWPRVPLPDNRKVLRASAALGRHVAALLDTEKPVPGVTSGKLRPEMKAIAVISSVSAVPVNPDAGDLAVTCGWGHKGKEGVTMPGKGKAIRRDYTPDELTAITTGASKNGLTLETALTHLGETTFDVYINEVVYWRNVPEKVWNYYIGGYQVIKKWLSYREQVILGRSLTLEEAREVTAMTRRLAAIALLEPALNANYAAVKESVYPWPGPGKVVSTKPPPAYYERKKA
jgi:hypothetical protein